MFRKKRQKQKGPVSVTITINEQTNEVKIHTHCGDSGRCEEISREVNSKIQARGPIKTKMYETAGTSSIVSLPLGQPQHLGEQNVKPKKRWLGLGRS